METDKAWVRFWEIEWPKDGMDLDRLMEALDDAFHVHRVPLHAYVSCDGYMVRGDKGRYERRSKIILNWEVDQSPPIS
jgi:hypothetical protein